MGWKLKKVVALPSNPDGDSIYFVKDEPYVRVVVTSHDGTPKTVFDQELVDARIAALSTSADGGASFPAATAIGGHRGVILNSSGQLAYANPNDISHANKLVGITTGAGNAGEDVTIKWAGEMIESSWNWSAGQDIYLGINGVLTSDITGITGFIQRIGHAVSPTKIFLKLADSILLS